MATNPTGPDATLDFAKDPGKAPGGKAFEKLVADTPVPGEGNLQTAAVASKLAINKASAGINKGAAEEKANIDTAGRASQVALDAQANQDLAQAKSTSAIYAKGAESIGKFDDAYAESHAKTLGEVKNGTDAMLRAQDDLKNTHIYNWWTNATTGGKILGIISQVLAGGLQGMTGQTGPTALDRVIEQDLAVQKLNLSAKSEVATQSSNLYRQLLDRLKDEPLAEAAMRNIAYNSVNERLKNAIGSMGEGQAKVNAQKMQAQLVDKQVESLNKVTQDRYAKLMNTNLAQSEAGIHLENAATARRGQDLDFMAKQAAASATQKGGIYGWTGSEIVARTLGPENFAKVKERWDNVAIFNQAATEVRDALTGKFSTEKAANVAGRLNQTYDDIKTRLGKTENLGALAKADLALVEGQLGASGGWDALLSQLIPGSKDTTEFVAAMARLSERVQNNMINEAETFTGPDGKPTRVDRKIAFKPLAPNE